MEECQNRQREHVDELISEIVYDNAQQSRANLMINQGSTMLNQVMAKNKQGLPEHWSDLGITGLGGKSQ